VVDIALITALHATGLTTPSAVAAVVLYRITTFKILGNLVWAVHQRVGAEMAVTSCGMRIFTDHAGRPVTVDSDGGHRPGGMDPVRYRTGNPLGGEV
jgi:hypothetical protein